MKVRVKFKLREDDHHLRTYEAIRADIVLYTLEDKILLEIMNRKIITSLGKLNYHKECSELLSSKTNIIERIKKIIKDHFKEEEELSDYNSLIAEYSKYQEFEMEV